MMRSPRRRNCSRSCGRPTRKRIGPIVFLLQIPSPGITASFWICPLSNTTSPSSSPPIALFAAEYDAGGRLLAVQSKPVKLGKSTYDFTLQRSNTNVKCFLLSTKTYAPLTEPFSIR